MLQEFAQSAAERITFWRRGKAYLCSFHTEHGISPESAPIFILMSIHLLQDLLRFVCDLLEGIERNLTLWSVTYDPA